MNSSNKEELVKFLKKYVKGRPLPKRKYDQFYATVETVAKRALFVQEKGDLPSRILLLGDDDLTSVALSKLGGSINPTTVLEIDTDITNLLKRTEQKEGLRINVLEHDLLEELPRKILNQFDIVFTDPPYTPSGISLFLNRAIESLKKAYTSRIYLCYGSGSRASDRELSVQNIINEKGLLIREKIEDFNEYSGAATIGNTSSLFVLEWTPQTKTTSLVNERIYTNQ